MFDFSKLYSIKYENSSKKSFKHKTVIKPEPPIRCGTDITVIVDELYKKSKRNFTKF